MYVGHFCSLHHFVHGDLSFIVTIHNVLRDGTIKKYGLLRVELVSKELNHFERIASFFRDWALGTLTGGA